MTTKVTIDAHAGWDVKVELTSLNEAKEVTGVREEIVPKHTVRDFYIHSHLKITEVSEV